MSLEFIGPPCAVCGKPATGAITLNTGAAAGMGIGLTQSHPSEPRCNEHNPYMTRCERGHYQFGGNYCSQCGAPLRESLKGEAVSVDLDVLERELEPIPETHVWFEVRVALALIQRLREAEVQGAAAYENRANREARIAQLERVREAADEADSMFKYVGGAEADIPSLLADALVVLQKRLAALESIRD